MGAAPRYSTVYVDLSRYCAKLGAQFYIVSLTNLFEQPELFLQVALGLGFRRAVAADDESEAPVNIEIVG